MYIVVILMKSSYNESIASSKLVLYVTPECFDRLRPSFQSISQPFILPWTTAAIYGQENLLFVSRSSAKSRYEYVI